MAPHLTRLQHAQIQTLLEDGSLSYATIASKIPCSKNAIKAISANLQRFGTTVAPHNGVGRPKRMTGEMLAALRRRLSEQPDLYLDEIADFRWEEYHVRLSRSTISRSLKEARWSYKVTRHIAQERNGDLRDEYQTEIAAFRPDHFVFVDESGANGRDGLRRRGWAPLGTAPTRVTRLHRGQRYQILPAMTCDGVLWSRVYLGTTDRAVFEDFIAQLLTFCGRWPEPRSVLVMDNASIHRSACIESMCADAGVKLMYLPPYSCDLNPIELFFARLKKDIRRHYKSYWGAQYDDFGAFLQDCVDRVGQDREAARNEFRHAGIIIDEIS